MDDFKKRYMRLFESNKIKKIVPKDDVPLGFYGGEYRGIPVEVREKRMEGFFFVDHLNKFIGDDSTYISNNSINYKKTVLLNSNKIGW